MLPVTNYWSKYQCLLKVLKYRRRQSYVCPQVTYVVAVETECRHERSTPAQSLTFPSPVPRWQLYKKHMITFIFSALLQYSICHYWPAACASSLFFSSICCFIVSFSTLRSRLTLKTFSRASESPGLSARPVDNKKPSHERDHHSSSMSGEVYLGAPPEDESATWGWSCRCAVWSIPLRTASCWSPPPSPFSRKWPRRHLTKLSSFRSQAVCGCRRHRQLPLVVTAGCSSLKGLTTCWQTEKRKNSTSRKAYLYV